jgi:hypothetical protein
MDYENKNIGYKYHGQQNGDHRINTFNSIALFISPRGWVYS